MRLRNIPGARETIAESQWIVQDPSSCKGKWRERFGNDHPVHLEIGTGKGKFINQLAQENPDINYVGIEKYSSVLIRALGVPQKVRADPDAGRNHRIQDRQQSAV